MGCAYEDLEFFAATGRRREPLSLYRFKQNPLQEFEQELCNGYGERLEEIQRFLALITDSEDIVLACWCPFSKDTMKQLEKRGMFACHTGIIGKVIKTIRPGLEIVMDHDRSEHLVPQWRPKLFTTIRI